MPVLKFVTHSRKVTQAALELGWLPGARYTNLRDIKTLDSVGFLDVDWRDYDFQRHLSAVQRTHPLMTVAKDIEDSSELDQVLGQAEQLLVYCKYVVVVPKDVSMGSCLDLLIPKKFILGFSVPTRYGATAIPADNFNRPVHLLGGRPDVQRKLADRMPVFSFDCNRFTLDAAFGDYFDGSRFLPHPIGGYERCIKDSLSAINKLWDNYPGP